MAARSKPRNTRRSTGPVRPLEHRPSAGPSLGIGDRLRVGAPGLDAAPAIPAEALVTPPAEAKPVQSTEPKSVRDFAPAALTQLLTFFAGGYEYAISILHVREIAEYRALTPVPGTPNWIRGVMNLRGTVVPAIDLAAKLGMPATATTRRTCLLIVEVEIDGDEAVLAIMVDGVSRVVDLSSTDLQEVPSFGTRIDIGFLVGMARLDKRLVFILDINRVVEAADALSAAALTSLVDSPVAGPLQQGSTA